MEIVIEVMDIHKVYKFGELDVKVLNGINIVVNKGEFVSIMGPSGSGKSTFLYLLGGLDYPTSGKICINGKDISEMNDNEQSALRRRGIGFIFQFYNLIPNMSVEENILLPILLDGKKVGSYKNKLDEVLDEVGLADRKNYTPKELSGGQQQRVAIARALIAEPDIILADEPIGNLDSKTGIGIMELFKEINTRKGITVVQVTHSKEAAEYGNNIIRFKDGKVLC